MADSTWVKFAAICLCCVTALLGTGTTDGKVVAAALCLTVGADWFLLVRDDHYLVGVGLFIAVQLLYAFRLFLMRGKVLGPFFLFRILALAGVVPLAVRGQWLLALSAFYFANLFLNHQEASGRGAAPGGYGFPYPLRRQFDWGLLLFLCCDVCVGLWNLGRLPEFTRVGMWLFYLPSQVLIVLSQELEKGDLDEKDI